MASTPARTPPEVSAGRRRRPLLVLVYAAFLALLAEGSSYLGLSVLAGHALSAGEVRAQMARAGELEEDSAAGFDQGQGPLVHPYLGYLSRSWIDDGEDLVRLESPDFYEPGSPIFHRSPDTVVVGLAGGSVAGGFVYDGGARELVGLLQGDARFAGKHFRFVSLTTGGWKQPQQLMALGFLLALGGRVDVLIALDGFNEVALHELENQSQGVAPIYPRTS